MTARYGLVNDGETAIAEVAERSGLHCVSANAGCPDRLQPGHGELLAALAHRPKTLIMGLGGSATTDGGNQWAPGCWTPGWTFLPAEPPKQLAM